MSDKLRATYDKISYDYLRKKQDTWLDFSKFLQEIDWQDAEIIIDIGGGNGRNLNIVKGNLMINFDLSVELLRGHIGPNMVQRVAGALPKLPIRNKSTDSILCLAVLHHFRDPNLVVTSLLDMRRIGRELKLVASVWRRWRSGLREKIIENIRHGKNIDHLINHDRPWYNSDRKVMGTRFYHYYTYKEIYNQITSSGLNIIKQAYLGGKYQDANIFVLISSGLSE